MGNRRMIIRGLSTLSAMGASRAEIDAVVREPSCRAQNLSERPGRAVFPLSDSASAIVDALREEERLARLDRVTHLAIAAARGTLAYLKPEDGPIGFVSIGSSRGATISLEKTIKGFGEDSSRVPTETSPSTTAGNISSWVAQECFNHDPHRENVPELVSLNTSMTCSSAFHSLLSSLAFVRSGMATNAIFGGSDACLTPYTVSHLEAVRIYSDIITEWPCRPGAAEGVTNTVVLGEGAGTGMLRPYDGSVREGDLELLSIGWAMERIPSATGMSVDGQAFEASMRAAVKELPPGRSVDCVVLHAPGSIRGDEAELRAISRVFGDIQSCSTKHLTGHTYGASGMVSLALAQSLLSDVPWPGFPYESRFPGGRFEGASTVLINTAGFGGNVLSLVVGLPYMSKKGTNQVK